MTPFLIFIPYNLIYHLGGIVGYHRKKKSIPSADDLILNRKESTKKHFKSNKKFKLRCKTTHLEAQ
jgi:hypothetical protein